jgi:hypothetical protein
MVNGLNAKAQNAGKNIWLPHAAATRMKKLIDVTNAQNTYRMRMLKQKTGKEYATSAI